MHTLIPPIPKTKILEKELAEAIQLIKAATEWGLRYDIDCLEDEAETLNKMCEFLERNKNK